MQAESLCGLAGEKTSAVAEQGRAESLGGAGGGGLWENAAAG